jgi:hypothetical protein
VTELDAGIFVNAGNLEYINLSFNIIRFIHKRSFEGLSKLIGLNLENNRVQMIHFKTFSALESLKILDLSNVGSTCVNKEFSLSESSSDHQSIEKELKTCHANYVEEVMDRGLEAYERTKEIQEKVDGFQIKDLGVSMTTIIITMGTTLLICISFVVVVVVFYLRYAVKNIFIHQSSTKRSSTQSDHYYSYYDDSWKQKPPNNHSPKLNNSNSDDTQEIPTKVALRVNNIDKKNQSEPKELAVRQTVGEIRGHNKIANEIFELERKSNIF